MSYGGNQGARSFGGGNFGGGNGGGQGGNNFTGPQNNDQQQYAFPPSCTVCSATMSILTLAKNGKSKYWTCPSSTKQQNHGYLKAPLTANGFANNGGGGNQAPQQGQFQAQPPSQAFNQNSQSYPPVNVPLNPTSTTDPVRLDQLVEDLTVLAGTVNAMAIQQESMFDMLKTLQQGVHFLRSQTIKGIKRPLDAPFEPPAKKISIKKKEEPEQEQEEPPAEQEVFICSCGADDDPNASYQCRCRYFY